MIISILFSASELLRFVVDKAKEDSNIKEIYLHVQISNEDAKKFYSKHGFEQLEIIKNYYTNIEPADCFLFKKIMQAP